MDPFAPTSDPSLYIPRAATESALRRLEDGFRHGRRVQVLSGPPGLGKTMLLHVLARRLQGGFRTLYLPYASLVWGDLCGWILGLLRETPGSFPDRELLASARRSALAGRPLLLLIDEASSMPLDTAERLAALVREAEGALRLLLVPLDDARAGRMLAVLARDVEELRLSAPLSPEETELYVRTRVARGDVPFDLQRRFDADTMVRLHRASGGNLHRLHHLASEVLRGHMAALAAAEAAPGLADAAADPERALEIDAPGAAATLESDADLPSPVASRAAGAPAARAQAAPAPARAAAAAPVPAETHVARAPFAPLGPPEPEATNWWFVAVFLLALTSGMVAGLWYGGLLPPR